jgi:hypothetical protein
MTYGMARPATKKIGKNMTYGMKRPKNVFFGKTYDLWHDAPRKKKNKKNMTYA